MITATESENLRARVGGPSHAPVDPLVTLADLRAAACECAPSDRCVWCDGTGLPCNTCDCTGAAWVDDGQW